MDFNLEEEWVEYSAAILAFVGFFIAILMSNPVFSYVSVSLLGLLMGRVFYIKHFSEPVFPFVIIMGAFLIGYFAGSFFVSRLIVLILFVGFFGLSYYLHKEKIITIFKSESFMK